MTLHALSQAIFLIAAMSVAGVVHVLWLRSKWSHQFTLAIDGGVTFRGRRLFGDNKRLCGFMVLPPMAAMIFLLLGAVRESLPPFFSENLWTLTAGQYSVLGFVAGLAFMLAELPNSFVKRRLGIAPGEVSQNFWLRPLFLVIDRVDSVLGVLLAVSLMVPVPIGTWIWTLVLGAAAHAGFSIAMHSLSIKARPL